MAMAPPDDAHGRHEDVGAGDDHNVDDGEQNVYYREAADDGVKYMHTGCGRARSRSLFCGLRGPRPRPRRRQPRVRGHAGHGETDVPERQGRMVAAEGVGARSRVNEVAAKAHASAAARVMTGMPCRRRERRHSRTETTAIGKVKIARSLPAMINKNCK
jgi:hypothetical protein